jgi:ATP-binding cassette, subfamily B, multidrug efflux pump
MISLCMHFEESTTDHVSLKVITRLFLRFFRPYWKAICITLVLALCAIAAELMLPQIVRLAMDRHITLSARKISFADDPLKADDPVYRDDPTLIRVPGEPAFFMLPARSSLFLPGEMRAPEQSGALLQQRFYFTSLSPEKRDVLDRHPGIAILSGGYLFIDFSDLPRLSAADLRIIRADDLLGLVTMAGLFIVVLASGFLFNVVQMYLVECTSQKIMHDIRTGIFRHLQNRCMSYFTHNPLGRLVTRATNDVQNLHELFNALFANIAKDICLVAGILILLFWTSWKLTLVCFALLPLLAVCTAYFSSLSRRAFREVRIKIAALNARVQENIAGLSIVKSFGSEARTSEQFGRLNHDQYVANMRQTFVFSIFTPMVDLMRLISMALIIWYGGGQLIRDTVSLGTIVLFLYYSRMFFRPIQDLTEKYNIIQSALASMERIYLLLTDTSEIRDPHNPVSPPAKGTIEFQHVSFAYNPNEPVLRNVSFTIPAGTTAAVVGLTGSGKTTIINLIERFYDVDTGRILIDGVDIHAMRQSDLRQRMALVMQDVFLFAGTVKFNLTLGRTDFSDAAVWQALQTVHADSIVARFPRKLDEVISEGGKMLSSGERQLLSCARAVLHDPEFLLLDEATASIDPLTEARIQDALKVLLHNRTSLIIAHRLSTIRNADQIIVLHKGAVHEQGTHAELIRKRGLYYKLLQLNTTAA